MQQVLAVELKVVSVGLGAGLARENEANVAVVCDDYVANFQVFEYCRHYMGDAYADAVLESRQIHYYGLPLHSVCDKFKESFALLRLHRVERAKDDDVVLIDTRPHHVEAVGRV